MSRFILLLFLILIGCSKSYIDSTDDEVTITEPMQVISTYSSVDFTEMNFYYSEPGIVNQLEIRRDTTEIPLTQYDGDLVFLDNVYNTVFYDYSETTDQETLSQGTTYYYSIFYRGNDVSVPPIRIDDLTLTTLTYKQGMLQLLDELTDFSINLNDDLEFLISSDLANVLFDEAMEPPTILDATIANKFDGIIVQSLQYVPDNTLQDSDQFDSNLNFLSLLSNSKVTFAVDYCTSTHTEECINPSRNTYTNNDIVGFIRPESLDNIVDDLPGIINETSNTNITDINDGDLKNFIFLDSPFDGMVSQLTTSNYDLIIMTPFDNDPSLSWDSLFSAEDVNSLKVKSNGESSRLVYAYIDISRIFKTNDFYWQTEWDQLEERPNWIDANISDNSDDFYIKYWRNDWKSILKQVLPLIINAGYDGIVFGGVGQYADFPLQI
ncbi:MAG: hypothetical protein VXX85_03950 [Candidatus Margulisiibacteriota bacterium]|nr:hypothetical protein [Candidatus Margulisiibacteriota bacterium]